MGFSELLIFLFKCLYWFCIFLKVNAKKRGHIGLFASTGTPSHDLLTHQLAQTFSDLNYDVTWIQYRVFDFNRTKLVKNSNWNQIIHDHVTMDTADLLRRSQEGMWTTTMPFDIRKLDFKAMMTLTEIYKHHSSACTSALQDPKFWNQLVNQKFDLIVLDYVLMECSTAMSAYLNCPVVYISNFPVSSSYSEWMNIPSNPGYVPSVLSPLPENMTFVERFKNLLFYIFVGGSRRLEILWTNLAFWKAGKTFLEPISSTDAKVLYFATVSEFMLESSRPQTHQIKYFGSPHALTHVQAMDIAMEMNISSISPHGVIVMSFGSITSGELIPKEIIQTFMNVFGNFSHTVIWQFGSKLDTKGVPVPSNVFLYDWIPLRQMLASPDVKLMVSHGGIRSILEAIHQGLPLLGIPIQGPQPHDLRRVVDRGAAEMIEIHELTEELLNNTLRHMLANYGSYKTKAEKLSNWITGYHQDLYNSITPGEFWLQWGIRHGRQLVENRKFYPYAYLNAFVYYNCDILFVFLLFLGAIYVVGCKLIMLNKCIVMFSLGHYFCKTFL